MDISPIGGRSYKFWPHIPADDAFMNALAEIGAHRSIEDVTVLLTSPERYVSKVGWTVLNDLVERGVNLRILGEDSSKPVTDGGSAVTHACTQSASTVVTKLATTSKHFVGVGAGDPRVALAVDHSLGTSFAPQLLSLDAATNWELEGRLERYQLVPGGGLVLRSAPQATQEVLVLGEFMNVDVKWLGQEAFAYHSVHTAHINKPLMAIGERCFKGSRLRKVTLPSTVINVQSEAFADTDLRTVHLPQGLQSIGAGAFRACKSLSKIRIPYTVTSIGEDAFAECSDSLVLEVSRGSFAEIWAARNNMRYSVQGGRSPNTSFEDGSLLYNRIGASSLEVSGTNSSLRGATNVSVPETVDGLPIVGIGPDAFSEMSELTSVRLPSGLLWIGARAFASSPGLTRDSAVGSSGVPFVAPDAFVGPRAACLSTQTLQMRDTRSIRVTPRMVLAHLDADPQQVDQTIDLDTPFSRVTGIPDTSVERTALFLGEEFWGEFDDTLEDSEPSQSPISIIKDARTRGARILVSSRPVPGIADDDLTVVLHPDPARAYEDIAATIRRQYALKAVTVTGSIGKTTTKDMLALVARSAYPTLASRGNMNSVGYVGPVMSGLTREHEVYIQETGASKFRAVEASAGIAQPTVFVATNIGRNHRLDYGDSQDALVRDKLSADLVLPDEGLAFLNLDDPHLRTAALNHRIVSFGVNRDDVDYQALDIQETTKRVNFTIVDNKTGSRTPVQLNVVGWHNVYSALAAFAVGRWLELSESEIAIALRDFQPSKIRQNLLEIGDQLVLVDCFNANEVSAVGSAASLKHLPLSRGGRRIYVFGGLGDRGQDTAPIHRTLGERLAELRVLDELVCFGEYAAHTAAGAREQGLKSTHFYDRAELHEYLKEAIQSVDVVGFKATRKTYLEQAPDAVWGTTYAVAGVNPKILRDIPEETSGPLRYKVLPARGALVTGVSPSHTGTVRVPKELNNAPVDALLRGSFDSSRIQRVVLQAPLRTLGRAAFLKCRRLHSVSLPSTLRIIERSTFQDCTTLQSLDIPNGTLTIGDYAFLRCRNLQRLRVPPSVVNIGDGAFARCPNLTIICEENSFAEAFLRENYPDLRIELAGSEEAHAVADTDPRIPGSERYDNSPVLRGGATFRRTSVTAVGLISGPKDVANFVVPSEVDGVPLKRIMRGSFERAQLEAIVIPSPVARIGRAAFLRCRQLRSVEIPISLKRIDRSAFRACSRLTRLELPEGVEVIGDFAFSACRKLALLTIPDSVTEIGDEAFRGCDRLTVVCSPESYAAAFIRENWPSIPLRTPAKI